MKITMTDTHRMSEDGFTVSLFEKGETYEVGARCAWNAINTGWAYATEPSPQLSASEIVREALKPPTREQMAWLMFDPFKKPVA